MARSLMFQYHLRILNPKFQKIWPKNKVARALPCLAWAPPNLADRQHSATGFCFGPFAKLFLVRLIWNFGFKFLIYKENCIPIAIWIEEFIWLMKFFKLVDLLFLNFTRFFCTGLIISKCGRPSWIILWTKKMRSLISMPNHKLKS